MLIIISEINIIKKVPGTDYRQFFQVIIVPHQAAKMERVNTLT